MIEARRDPEWLKELKRKNDIRTNSLSPINLMWTSSVPVEFRAAAMRGLEEMLDLAGQPRGINTNLHPLTYGSYSSADWYVEEAAKRSSTRTTQRPLQKIYVDELHELFSEEPWQDIPHADIILINHSVREQGLSSANLELNGSTNCSIPSAIVTISEIQAQISDEDLKVSMLKDIVKHEVGHMLGIPNAEREDRGGHCGNNCLMASGMTIKHWEQSVMKIPGVLPQSLCTDCTNDYRQKPRYV